MDKATKNRRGLARIELTVLVGCAGVLFAIIGATQDAVRLGDKPGSKTAARSIKDATQLTHLHGAMIVFAQQLDGSLPRPGLINLLPHPIEGDVPGIGDEDVSLNTTANLYSCMVAQNYLNTPMLISPVERNPNVTVDKDFNFEAYSPINDQYWDRTFVADLDEGSNTSYAHMPIVGEWATSRWRDHPNSTVAVLGNRGPRQGQRDHESYTCDPHGYWSGNVVFADNHVEFWRNATHPKAKDPDDNIFADGGNILAFTASIEDGKPVLQWD